MRAVRACHYDVVINLADQWRSAIITGLSGAPVRIGFAYRKRDNAFWRWCHNQLVSTDRHHQLHTVEQNMTALQPLGIPTAGATASMHFSTADQQKCRMSSLSSRLPARLWCCSPPRAGF